MTLVTITLDDGEQDFILGIAGQLGQGAIITPVTALSIAGKIREARELISMHEIYSAGKALGIITASLEIRLSAQSNGPYGKDLVLSTAAHAGYSSGETDMLLGYIEDERP